MPQRVMRCSEADRASTTSSKFQAWTNSEITLFNNNNNKKNQFVYELPKDLPSETEAQA